jgi:hypothetical protein
MAGRLADVTFQDAKQDVELIMQVHLVTIQGLNCVIPVSRNLPAVAIYLILIAGMAL